MYRVMSSEMLHLHQDQKPAALDTTQDENEGRMKNSNNLLFDKHYDSDTQATEAETVEKAILAKKAISTRPARFEKYMQYQSYTIVFSFGPEAYKLFKVIEQECDEQKSAAKVCSAHINTAI
jgi:hypothetical protein